MANRHTELPNTFAGLYRRLEEVILGNSGADEFEEILKLLVLKIWADTNGYPHTEIDDIDEANQLLRKADNAWPSVLTDTHMQLTTNQYSKCAEALENFSFNATDYDLIDAVFEYVVNRKKKGDKGQYFTPRYVIDFCVRCLNINGATSIADPASGSGAFLYHAAHANNVDASYWGFDFDETTVRIARLLKYISGVKDYHLFNVNSLLLPESQSRELLLSDAGSISTIEDCLRCNGGPTQFDAILTNPPFAGEVSESSILDHYDLAVDGRRAERDILFIERCVNLLKPHGRLAIVLPDNVFGRKSNEVVRAWILNKARIVGVVGLQRETFQPHTSVKTSILFLEKRSKKRHGDENVFFGISEKSGKNSRGIIQYRMEPQGEQVVDCDLDNIADEFEAFRLSEGMDW